MNTKSKLDGKKTTNWQEKFSKKAKEAKSSAIRELLEIASQPEVISFAGGLPATETLPLKKSLEALSHFSKEEKNDILQYCCTEGIAGLRNYLSETMCQYGIEAEPENILPTSGSQQALDLLGRIFLDPGDVIISSAPTYTGAIQAFKNHQAKFVTVDLDENGMVPEQVEEKLKTHHPKFIYVLPNFHNPGGVTLSKQRRHKLVEIAAVNNVFIVEDDPYGELRYEGDNITPLLPLHKENVIYLSTFSKTLAPGFRLGWVTAPQEVIGKLVLAKQGADLCTPAFVQNIALYMCEEKGFFKNRVGKLQKLYKSRRDAMLEAMEANFPKEVRWNKPQGGLFLWASLPEKANTEELFHLALDEKKVAFVYGSAFFPNTEFSNSMRLNFSYMNCEKIKEGIERLGDAIKKYLN